MSQLSPFVNYFVEESLSKKSLHKLHDEDINKACLKIQEQAVYIVPKGIFSGTKRKKKRLRGSRLLVYPSKKDKDDYLLKSEQLIEALHGVRGPVVFEIVGNKKKVVCCFFAESRDFKIIYAAINNLFPNSINVTGKIKAKAGRNFIYDFVPKKPFYKPLTSFNTFVRSPLNSIVQLLLNIDDDREGVYQVLFSPAADNCHGLVRDAIDADYMALKGAEVHVRPSLQSTGDRVEYKSPQFKSYYSVCVRLILPTDKLEGDVKAFISNYAYGSREFLIFDNTHYTEEQIHMMLNKKVSFHMGFLVNSHELTSMVHIPFQALDNKAFRGLFEEAPAGDRPLKTLEYNDVSIGRWACGADPKKIYMPDPREIPHIHIQGLSRVGKSILLASMALQKLLRGEACFVLDFHGDLAINILKMVPHDKIDDVYVIDFGMNGATPQLTIRDNVDTFNLGKAADDLSVAMKDIASVSEKTWYGPRMSFAFACLFLISLTIPKLNLLDLRRLISPSKKGDIFREKIKSMISNPILRDFLDEIKSIGYESLAPVITRLSHLLLDERSLRFFTLDKNSISIRNIMENGRLCIVNLSIGLNGRQRASMLSGLLDGLIDINLLERASISYEMRKPLTRIKDEFHLGPGDLEAQFTGLAKYGSSIVVAHQHLDQLTEDTRAVVSTAGARVVFKLKRSDAEIIGRDLGIDPEEITSLRQFEAFLKVEDEVVKINTPEPMFNSEDYSDVIMRNCLEKYYLIHDDSTDAKEKKRLSFDTL